MLGFAAAGASLISETLAAVFGCRCGLECPSDHLGRHGRLATSGLGMASASDSVDSGLGWHQLAAGRTVAWRTCWRGPGYHCLLAAVMIICLGGAPRQPGWPPRDWVMVACDVGQGDGARSTDRARQRDRGGQRPDTCRDATACLDRLGIRRVPLLIITHFHADHVAGLTGVLRHRRIGQLWMSPLARLGR